MAGFLVIDDDLAVQNLLRQMLERTGYDVTIACGGRIEAANYLSWAKRLGAQRTLSKPFSRREMLDAVRARVESREQ